MEYVVLFVFFSALYVQFVNKWKELDLWLGVVQNVTIQRPFLFPFPLLNRPFLISSGVIIFTVLLYPSVWLPDYLLGM